MELEELVEDFADALAAVDATRPIHKRFQPGIGPFGEPQLVKSVLASLKLRRPDRWKKAATKRNPDLLVPKVWAIEVKIARPFGDNGAPAEHWSENLLHPYPGNTSAIGDCFKLSEWSGEERKAVVIVGYEHVPPQVDIEVALSCFELSATRVCEFDIGARVEAVREGLVHPVHQRVRVAGYEVLGRSSSSRPSRELRAFA